MTLNIGDEAPDFSLPSDHNTTIRLSELRGKKVLLYFYPKDNTPGCTREACDFRDAHTDFARNDIVILGVSKDTTTRHQKFKTQYQLPFTLLTDANADVCESYGVINKKSLFGKTFLGITRSTFLIDEHGKISALWRKVKVSDHIQQVLEAIQSVR